MRYGDLQYRFQVVGSVSNLVVFNWYFYSFLGFVWFVLFCFVEGCVLVCFREIFKFYVSYVGVVVTEREARVRFGFLVQDLLGVNFVRFSVVLVLQFWLIWWEMLFCVFNIYMFDYREGFWVLQWFFEGGGVGCVWRRFSRFIQGIVVWVQRLVEVVYLKWREYFENKQFFMVKGLGFWKRVSMKILYLLFFCSFRVVVQVFVRGRQFVG